MDLCPPGFMHPQPEGARHILSQIINPFAIRRMQQLSGLQNFLYLHGHAHPVLKRKCFIQQNCFLLRKLRQRVVSPLAVINIAESDPAPCHGPAVVRPDRFLRSVRKQNPRLGNQFPAISVEAAFLFPGSIAKPALVPSVSQCNGNLVFLPEHLRNVIGLRLNPFFIIVAVGRQPFLSDPLSVDLRLIKPQAADIQSRRADFLPGQRESLVEDRKPLLVVVTGNPPSQPRLVHLARFKPVLFAFGFLPGIALNADCPAVPGPGLQIDFHLGPQRIQRTPSGVVKQSTLCSPFPNPKPGRFLPFARRVLRYPGKNRYSNPIPHRILNVVHTAFCNVHFVPSRQAVILSVIRSDEAMFDN